MGACYSKNNPGGRTSVEGKGNKLKLRLFEQNKKWNTEELSQEKVPLKNSERDLEDKINSPNTRTSTADIVSDHANLKQIDHSIAPSDSGIESIGTAQDEVQGNARSKQEKDELLKRLEHQNLKVCQNCGHLKLNDFSLLTNSDILCDSSLTGRSIVKPKLEAQSLQNKGSASLIGKMKYDLKVFTDSNKNAALSTSSDINHACKDTVNSEQLMSSSEKSNSANRDTDCLSVPNNCHIVHTSTSADKTKNKISKVIIEEKNRMKAPLAQYDSLDTNQIDDSTSKQQHLLSDFQDITESLCKCDSFYSSPEKDHGNNANSTEGTQAVSITELGAGGQSLDKDEQTNHLIITGQESPSHLNQAFICKLSKTHEKSFTQKLSFSSREKSSSLPKNVSFAHHKATKCQATTQSASPSIAKPIPVSREIHVNHCESSVSESSSGVYTHQTVSRSFFSNGQKDTNQCSASLGSVEAMISDSGSDILMSGTEDDMTSLDLDNISRFTSQSTASIRQLMGSAEEVSSSLQIALPTTVDGMDCVIIPKETYHQMQTDLSVLKQQLICLSSIIQESEGPEQKNDHESKTDFIPES